MADIIPAMAMKIISLTFSLIWVALHLLGIWRSGDKSHETLAVKLIRDLWAVFNAFYIEMMAFYMLTIWEIMIFVDKKYYIYALLAVLLIDLFRTNSFIKGWENDFISKG